MRKYLFIAANEWPEWGGSELLWSAAAEKLAVEGNEVRVSVPAIHKTIPQIERLRLVGCRMFYRRVFPPFFYRLGIRVLPLPDYRCLHVRSIARGVDLVVVSQGGVTSGVEWMEALRSINSKYSVIAQAAGEQWWPNDNLAEILAERYEKATVVYFVSRANMDLGRRQLGTPLHNGRVIRNPFNVRYDAQPPWPSDFPDGLSLACVARLDVVQKGQDLLLEVLGLPHWRQRKVRVSLVGRGIHERGLRRIVEQQKLTSVEFVGFSNDIEDVWSKHHALVLASRYEGMPLALVEAMLCGRPVIVTDVADHKELVRDGVNGFLARAATPASLDEAMSRAWDNRNGLREMGRRAAADVRGWVSPDPAGNFARELAELASSSGNLR